MGYQSRLLGSRLQTMRWRAPLRVRQQLRVAWLLDAHRASRRLLGRGGPKPGPPSSTRGGSPGTGQWTLELTGPGRKLPGRATRGACSGSVPRTPCPCGLSAVHPPVGRQTYLQPCWDERAPSRPTYQRPNSLPQSPRGIASSSSRSFRQRHLHSSPYRIRCVSTHPARFARPNVASEKELTSGIVGHIRCLLGGSRTLERCGRRRGAPLAAAEFLTKPDYDRGRLPPRRPGHRKTRCVQRVPESG